MGKLKRCGIHWDRAGISKGTADVEYEYCKDAERAIEYLNGKFIYF
jgi:RNA recognition motif-containing protein